VQEKVALRHEAFRPEREANRLPTVRPIGAVPAESSPAV
jgi:hypothetical protein